MPEPTEIVEWTCGRCEVSVRWLASGDAPSLPATWVDQHGELHCLDCRRDLAAEAGLLLAPAGASADERREIESRARIEFELRRNPRRQDSRIASSCKAPLEAVREERTRLGMQSQGSGRAGRVR